MKYANYFVIALSLFLCAITLYTKEYFFGITFAIFSKGFLEFVPYFREETQ